MATKKKFQGRFARKKPKRDFTRKKDERKELQRSLEDEGLDDFTDDLNETETELINRFIAEMGLDAILRAPQVVFQRWAGKPSRKQTAALRKIEARLMRPGERAAPPVPKPRIKTKARARTRSPKRRAKKPAPRRSPRRKRRR